MIKAINSSKRIGSDENLELLRDHSQFKILFNLESNIQFLQFIPEWKLLKLSISIDKSPAYLKNPIEYNLNKLFAHNK